jgi:hypothetical protein
MKLDIVQIARFPQQGGPMIRSHVWGAVSTLALCLSSIATIVPAHADNYPINITSAQNTSGYLPPPNSGPAQIYDQISYFDGTQQTPMSIWAITLQVWPVNVQPTGNTTPDGFQIWPINHGSGSLLAPGITEYIFTQSDYINKYYVALGDYYYLFHNHSYDTMNNIYDKYSGTELIDKTQ